MATPKDTHLYDVLHVTPKASPKAIKAAYHRLALTHHPDRFIDANADVLAKFQQITEAYGVLRDPEQKKLYDEQGFRAAIGRDPERAVESPNDKGKDAKELYGLYERDFDRDDDLEMDDLLEWWTSGEPAKLDAKAGLRTDAETFYGQLCDAFDQFRLTHAATTNDDPRSKTATPGESYSTALIYDGLLTSSSLLEFCRETFWKGKQKCSQ